MRHARSLFSSTHPENRHLRIKVISHAHAHVHVQCTASTLHNRNKSIEKLKSIVAENWKLISHERSSGVNTYFGEGSGSIMPILKIGTGSGESGANAIS